MTQSKKTEVIHKAAQLFNKKIKSREYKTLTQKQALAFDIAREKDIKPDFFVQLMAKDDRNILYR